MKAKPNQQVSRLHSAKRELSELISIANLVPAKYEMPELLSEMAGRELTGESALASFRRSIGTRFPAKQFAAFRKFVGPIRRETWNVASSNYSLVRIARGILYVIAGASGPGLLELPPLGLHELGSVVINADGRIQPLLGMFFRIIEGVEAARIRKCPVCGAIFWAGRIDKPSCSRRCGKILRTREWRERYRDRYKEQRYQKSEQQSHPKLRQLKK